MASVTEKHALRGLSACTLDPITDPRWAELLRVAPSASVFHHPAWLALVRDTYRYPMNAVCVQDRAGALVAGLPIATVRSRLTGTRLVSVPFSDLCGPLLCAAEHESALMAAIDAERRRASLRLEVHAELPGLPDGAPWERFYHHVVPLEGGIDEVRRRMSSKKRAGAARSSRQG